MMPGEYSAYGRLPEQVPLAPELREELSLLLNKSSEVVQSSTDTNNGDASSTDTVRNATALMTSTTPHENASGNTSAEDLSYSYLISLGIKRDTEPYNGETTWNAMSDDEKRTVIAYVTQNIANYASKRNTLYASKFLGSNVWKTKA